MIMKNQISSLGQEIACVTGCQQAIAEETAKTLRGMGVVGMRGASIRYDSLGLLTTDELMCLGKHVFRTGGMVVV